MKKKETPNYLTKNVELLVYTPEISIKIVQIYSVFS